MSEQTHARYAHRHAMRKAEVEPLTRGWMRARPLEPLSVGQFQGDKHAKKTKAPKISKKQHPFQEPEPEKKSHQKHHKKTKSLGLISKGAWQSQRPPCWQLGEISLLTITNTYLIS